MGVFLLDNLAAWHSGKAGQVDHERFVGQCFDGFSKKPSPTMGVIGLHGSSAGIKEFYNDGRKRTEQ